MIITILGSILDTYNWSIYKPSRYKQGGSAREVAVDHGRK